MSHLSSNSAPRSRWKIPKHSSYSAGTLSFITSSQAGNPPLTRFFGSRGFTSPMSATSEGESYLRFARAMALIPPADVFTRATTEDAALDSFQNVLFSVARFREVTGVYPARITVVGHDFKRRRFEQLHRRALRWSKLRFTYVGIPLGSEADEREAASGEVGISFSQYYFPPFCNLIICSLLYFRRPTRSPRTRQTCMVATRPSSRSAQDGIFIRRPTVTTLVRQKCASC